MRWKLYLTTLLIISSGVLYYNFSGGTDTDRLEVFVSRVVDGDTIEFVYGGESYKARLLGINTPETGMWYYSEATEFLESLVLNKSVEIENFGTDMYGRFLVYVFRENMNINKEILQGGFASLYYYEHDDYFDDLKKSEEFARNSQIGIWKHSSDFGCIKLVSWERDEPEKLVLENVCDFDIEVIVKDDATHIYSETLNVEEEFLLETSHIWNTGGDSLYVWGGGEKKGLLVFERY